MMNNTKVKPEDDSSSDDSSSENRELAAEKFHGDGTSTWYTLKNYPLPK